MAAKTWLDMSNWTQGEVTFAQAIGLGKYIKYPQLTAVLPAQANAASVAAADKAVAAAAAGAGAAAAGGVSGGSTGGSTGSGTGGSPNPPASSGGGSQGKVLGTGARNIYQGLISVGASPVQAIGLLANAVNESSLNPEAVGDGGTSFGLWQFHEPGYPNAHTLVTGNPGMDIVRQINYLVQVGGLRAASGSTGSQVAGNFAANFERCVGCQAGGAQWNSRRANVAGLARQLGVNTV